MYPALHVKYTERDIRITNGRFLYRFSRSNGLLAGIEILGQEWLAGRTGIPNAWASPAVDPRGQRYTASFEHSAEVDIVKETPEEVVICASGRLHSISGDPFPLRYDVSYAIQHDGTISVTVTFEALEELWLRWLSFSSGSISRLVGGYLLHEVDASYSFATCQPRMVSLDELPEGGIGGRFIPWLHLGNNAGGLDVVFPESAGIALGWTDTSPYPSGDPLGAAYQSVTVSKDHEGMTWDAYSIRNLRQRMARGERREHRFYLTPIPARLADPALRDIRVWWEGPHQYRSGWVCPDRNAIRSWAREGINLVIGGANWRSGDYLHPDSPEDVRRFIEECHANGIRVIPYVTFNDLEYGAPAFNGNGVEWRIEPVAEFNYRSHLMCTGAEGWREHWKREIRSVVESFDFDGLYIDFWAGRLLCRNELHGCKGPFGRFNAPGISELARFACELVKSKDPANIIVSNTNIMPIGMINNWVDARLLGEWGNVEETEKNALRFFYNGERFGCQNLLLTGRVPVISERTLAFAAACSGSMAVHPPASRSRQEILSAHRLSSLLSLFGVDRSEHINPWRLWELVPSLPPHIYVNVYKRDGSCLILISNMGQELVSLQFREILPHLGLPQKGSYILYDVQEQRLPFPEPVPLMALASYDPLCPGGSLRFLRIDPVVCEDVFPITLDVPYAWQEERRKTDSGVLGGGSTIIEDKDQPAMCWLGNQDPLRVTLYAPWAGLRAIAYPGSPYEDERTEPMSASLSPDAEPDVNPRELPVEGSDHLYHIWVSSGMWVSALPAR